jgi:adenylate kinase
MRRVSRLLAGSLILALVGTAAGQNRAAMPLELAPAAMNAPQALMAPTALLSPSALMPPSLLPASSILAAPSPSAPAVAAPSAPLAAEPVASLAASPAAALPAAVSPESTRAEAARSLETGGEAPGAVFDGSTAPALRLLISGPPGAGKGEASTRLTRDYGLVHISAGELLREHAKTDPAVAAVMKRGELVEADLVLRLVRERLAREDVAARGFILDGFPRRMVEAEVLKKELMQGGIGLDAIIVLNVREEELLRRILARGRDDDKEVVFRERMRIEREITRPAVDLLRGLVPVLSPDVSRITDADDSYTVIKAALENFLAGRGLRPHAGPPPAKP